MKKSLFKLMMTLAIVFGLSVSAWAQSTVGSAASPMFQFPGAQHTFSIDASAGTTSWAVYEDDGSTVVTTADCDPINQLSTATDPDEFTTQWAETASGTYIVRVTDQNTNGCITVRDFYVTIAEFDVYVYAADASGDRIMTDDLADCGANSAYNPFDNDLEMLFSNSGETTTDTEDDGSLDLVRGTSTLSQRYVAVEIHSDDIDFSTLSYHWRFDFTIAGDTDDDFVRAVAITSDVSVDGDGATTVTVAPNTTSSQTQEKILLRLDTEVRWGTDINIAMDIAANSTTMSRNGSDWNAGEEPTANYDDGTSSGYATDGDPRSNRSETQVIQGAPATSVISVD